MIAGARWRPFAAPTLALGAFLALAALPDLWASFLGVLFPEERRLLFQDPMLGLVGEHLAMVGLSSGLAVTVGLALGVFVTRPAGADFLGVVTDLVNLGQTFPPVAVFTLAVPLLGYGFEPTVLALTLYSILPVLQNTVAGLSGLPQGVVESARAMGMRPLDVLRRVELPLATPVILSGVRVAVVANVATATIGAIAGAGGLGAPIISGLVNQDPAVTLQGAILAAALALIVDAYLGAAERALARSTPGGARAPGAPGVQEPIA